MFQKNFVRFFVISLFFFLAIIFHTNSVFAQHPCDNFPITTCVVPSALETWTVNENNTSATPQAGEPFYFAGTSQRTLWISWIAPKTRVYVLDTRGTNPNNVLNNDTIIRMFSGPNTTFGALTFIDENEDWNGVSPCLQFFSTLRGTEEINSSCTILYATAGVRYYFQVDGDGSPPIGFPNFGQYKLNLKPLNEPTAANATISGRVTNENGRGISRTTVSLTDINGNTRTATTNPFGYYRFADIESGQNYTLVANRKGYQFENNPRVINVSENIEGENFVGSNPFLKRE